VLTDKKYLWLLVLVVFSIFIVTFSSDWVPTGLAVLNDSNNSAPIWISNDTSFTIEKDSYLVIYLDKQFADPDWMPYSFWYNDFPGTRILFQLLFGWILKYIRV